MAKKVSGIYCIQNTITEKVYIGSAVNVKHRLLSHKSVLKRNKHHSKHLQNSWNKYGETNFSFYILEEVDKNQLIEREQFYLDLFKSYDRKHGYNLAPKAGSSLGHRHSKESIKNMSIGTKKYYETHINFLKGKHIWDAKYKKNLSENHHMKKITKELIKEIRSDKHTSHTDLAPKVGLTLSQVHNIRAGKSWPYTYPELIWTKDEMKTHKLLQWQKSSRKRSKFTADDIKDIRLNYKDTNVKLAKIYRVSDTIISYIRYGKSWPTIHPELIWRRQ